MTIWVLRQNLTPEDEAQVFSRTDLMLPFEGMPDLSKVTNMQEARQLMSILHPADPPESISRRVERFWSRYSLLQMGDLIAVPLVALQQVVLAEVSGHYHYRVGDHGSDIHLIPVRWYEKRIPMHKLARHKDLFAPTNSAMIEVEAQDARVALRDTLPHSYNRFARMKWLLGALLVLGMLRMIIKF